MAKAHGPKFLALVEESRKRVGEFSIGEVKRKLDAGEEFPLIDVREGEEYASGHLPGAESLCKGIIERDIETMVPDLEAPSVGRSRLPITRTTGCFQETSMRSSEISSSASAAGAN